MPEKEAAIQRRARPEPEPLDLEVLYEDETLIAVNKPPGIVVHPTYRNWTGTLLNGLLWRFRDRPAIQPRIITRLDKGTSGLVLVALTGDAQARLQKLSAAGGLTKEYLAVVRGVPDPASGVISLPLARDTTDRRLVVVTPDGQPSTTHYEVLSESDDRAVVRCELVTGRTHQLRVHLAASGWPVLGDPVYGVPCEGLTRQALHAWGAALTHPVSGRLLEIEAPIAPDLQPFMP